MTSDGSQSEAYRDGSYHAAVFDDDPFVSSVLAERRARKLARWIRPTDNVFEFGVGTALNLRALKCAARAGCDPGPAAAQRCAEFDIEFVADLEALSGRQFDVVLCHHVLEHVTDPMAVLRQMRPHLKPGGCLVLVVPYEFNRRYRRWWPGEPNRHLFAWNALTLGNLVTEAGFSVNESGIGAYGYEQRLAPLARFGRPLYEAGIWLANRLRPCLEIRLIAIA